MTPYLTLSFEQVVLLCIVAAILLLAIVFLYISWRSAERQVSDLCSQRDKLQRFSRIIGGVDP